MLDRIALAMLLAAVVFGRAIAADVHDSVASPPASVLSPSSMPSSLALAGGEHSSFGVSRGLAVGLILSSAALFGVTRALKIPALISAPALVMLLVFAVFGFTQTNMVAVSPTSAPAAIGQPTSTVLPHHPSLSPTTQKPVDDAANCWLYRPILPAPSSIEHIHTPLGLAEPIWFYHFPKTGGTAIEHVLTEACCNKNFKHTAEMRAAGCPILHQQYELYSQKNCSIVPSEIAQGVGCGWHVNRHLWELCIRMRRDHTLAPSAKMHFLTQLRKPVTRVLSEFMAQRRFCELWKGENNGQWDDMRWGANMVQLDLWKSNNCSLLTLSRYVNHPFTAANNRMTRMLADTLLDPFYRTQPSLIENVGLAERAKWRWYWQRGWVEFYNLTDLPFNRSLYNEQECSPRRTCYAYNGTIGNPQLSALMNEDRRLLQAALDVLRERFFSVILHENLTATLALTSWLHYGGLTFPSLEDRYINKQDMYSAEMYAPLLKKEHIDMINNRNKLDVELYDIVAEQFRVCQLKYSSKAAVEQERAKLQRQAVLEDPAEPSLPAWLQ